MKDELVPLNTVDLSVSYDRKTVIHDIDLTVENGETYGLMGLNGAGKTTFIKAVLGLKNIDKGKIELFGGDRLEKTNKAQLAYLPERFEPPWFLSGLEFIRFSLSLYNQKMQRAEIEAAAESLALDPKVLKKRVQTYSKGMRQKVGLLGTVLTGCKFLILDEPMSGLDPRARSLVKDMLRSIKKEGRTIFLSSHILADMDEICDRVCVMHDGTIQYTGTPADMKKQVGDDSLERAFMHFVEQKDAA